MNWVESYKSKLVGIEEAVQTVKSGDRIFVSGNAATPFEFIRALAQRKNELENIQVNHLLLIGDDPLSAEGMETHFRHNSFFVGPADREAVNNGHADYVPIFLSQVPSLFTKRIIQLDVALLHVSPPDEHGFMSLGVECVASKAAVESAKFVVVMVNEKMPRTLGDTFIHISRAHKIVHLNREIPELQKKGFSEAEKLIGQHIATLIEDGSTLQMGIGGIPDAVLAALGDKKDLGVHSEMVSDGVMELIDQGVITNAKKTMHQGKAVATFIYGSKKLYEFVNNNPLFEVHPCNYTNDPFIIAQNEKMVAINSAIEVDITGQVCADSIGTKIYSGFGGQIDFIRGAAYSKGGKPIIALPSTTNDETLSRIVSILKPGAGVVTTRADVHYVVTEYGIAFLHGKGLKDRTQAMINIAHPKFRHELESAARARKLI